MSPRWSAPMLAVLTCTLTCALTCALTSVRAHAEAQHIAEATGADGYFHATLASPAPLALNRMVQLELTLIDSNRTPVDEADISITGGMPAHDHGLPTAPRVTQHLGAGRYLIEGVRFHMLGEWQLVLTVRRGDRQDVLTLDFAL